MENKTMGEVIAQLRREKNMTQRELAEKLAVTDKAVSKWERDLACPDTMTLAPLAQELGVGVEDLLGAHGVARSGKRGSAVPTELILKAVPLAMGVAVVVLNLLGEGDVDGSLSMLGLGLACLALGQMRRE